MKSHQIHPRWFTTGYGLSPNWSLAFAPSSVKHSSDIRNFTSSNNLGLLLLHSSVGLHPSFSGHGIIKASFILLIWLNENDPLRGTFSRHGITRTSSVLLIWLNENDPLHGTFSRHGITRTSSVLLIWLHSSVPRRGTFSRHGITQRVREERATIPHRLGSFSSSFR